MERDRLYVRLAHLHRGHPAVGGLKGWLIPFGVPDGYADLRVA